MSENRGRGMGGKWRLKMAKFHHINIENCQRIKHLKLTKIAKKKSPGFPKFYTHLSVSTQSSIYECPMLVLSVCCLGSHFLRIYFLWSCKIVEPGKTLATTPENLFDSWNPHGGKRK